MNYLNEKREDLFAKHALEKGFELVRDTGKHNIWKHKSGAQITSPKTTSDWRAIKNFKSELKARLQQRGVTSKPVTQSKPDVQPKPSQSSTAERTRYQQGQSLRTGSQTTFKDFMNKIQKAKASASSRLSLSDRMAAAYDRNQDKIPSSAKLPYKPGFRTASGVGLADSYVPEQMTAPKIMNKNQLDLRTTKEKQQEIDIPAKLLPFNPKIGDQYKTSQLDPGKSYIPKDTDQPHFDSRTPADKLRALQLRVKYYGGYPPKGPK